MSSCCHANYWRFPFLALSGRSCFRSRTVVELQVPSQVGDGGATPSSRYCWRLPESVQEFGFITRFPGILGLAALMKPLRIAAAIALTPWTAWISVFVAELGHWTNKCRPTTFCRSSHGFVLRVSCTKKSNPEGVCFFLRSI